MAVTSYTVFPDHHYAVLSWLSLLFLLFWLFCCLLQSPESVIGVWLEFRQMFQALLASVYWLFMPSITHLDPELSSLRISLAFAIVDVA